MNKIFLLSLSTLIFVIGCAGSKPKPVTNKDLPEWYLNPPKFEDKFVGVGDALRPQFSLSKQVATERARVEVARAVETTVNSSLNDHMQASGMGMESGSTEFTESVSKSLVSTTLKGCTIEKTEIFKDRVFVMVTYDAKKAREDLGWTPKISLEELVEEMVDHDIEKAKKLVYINKKGFKENNSCDN